MRGMNTAAKVLVVGVSLTLLAGCGQYIDQLKARNELNKGVTSFGASDYNNAVGHFEKAIELDPELMAARSYRASAYMMQYIPGIDSEENFELAQKALEGFEDVLERNPGDEVAMSSIASLYFNMAELEAAKEWNQKLVERFPDKKEAYYTLGVISWTEAYQPRIDLRASIGMQPDDPGPIKDVEKRDELAAQSLPIVDEGITMLAKALEIDPDYEDAMAYTNLLYREKADLQPTQEEHDEFIAEAEKWVDKTLETKKRKAEAGTVDQFHQEEF